MSDRALSLACLAGCLMMQSAWPQEAAPPGSKEFDPFAEDAKNALETLGLPPGEEARDFLDPAKVTALTEEVKPALVTVRQMGRDGGQRGTGSG